jgi:membrane-associated HD superfamily phosphohydrolase
MCFRLVFRRAACYHKLNDPERSAYELKICRDLIKKTAGLDRKKIDSFCKEMDQLSRQIAVLNQRKEENEEQQTTSYKNLDDLIQKSQTPTETLAACLSKSTEQKINEEFCPPSPPSPPRSIVLINESKLLLNGSNEHVPCASSTVRVAYSKDKGRHIIANQDIPSDSLILNERPYACLLLPKFAYTYCDHWLV